MYLANMLVGSLVTNVLLLVVKILPPTFNFTQSCSLLMSFFLFEFKLEVLTKATDEAFLQLPKQPSVNLHFVFIILSYYCKQMSFG